MTKRIVPPTGDVIVQEFGLGETGRKRGRDPTQPTKYHINGIDCALTADLLGLSVRAVQQTVEPLTPIRTVGAKNYYLPREALPLFLVESKQLEHDKAMKKARLSEVENKAEYYKQRALKDEIESNKLLGNLHDAEDCEASWSETISGLVKALDTLPVQFISIVEKDKDKRLEKAEKLVNRVKEGISKKFHEFS